MGARRRANSRNAAPKTSGGNFAARDVAAAAAIAGLSIMIMFSAFGRDGARGNVAIAAPTNVSPGSLALHDDPVGYVEAKIHSSVYVHHAVAVATASIPAVPWGEFGLARREVNPSEIVWDDRRERYVVDLDDGTTAILSLDRDLQRRIERTVERYNEPGQAAVAIDPDTGLVRAMVSRRTTDDVPEHLSLRSWAAAASTFKVVTGASLIANRRANPGTDVCYHGGGQGITADLLEDNAELDTNCLSMQRAMGYSANVVFGKLAVGHLSPSLLQQTANELFFNAHIPFEATIERSRAQIPGESVAFANTAAGFRDTTLSPLHGALMEAAIANDGVMMVPALIEEIVADDGTVVWTHEPVEWARVFDAETARSIRNAQATTCASGTARRQFHQRRGWPSAITVWGKTGTLSRRDEAGNITDPLRNYSWFVGFAEKGDDSIAVAGLVVQDASWEIRGSYLASELVLGALHR